MNLISRAHAITGRQRILALLATAAVAGGAGSLMTAGTASADPTGYSSITPYLELNAANSSLAIDVSGASTAPGAPIIQWYDNGGSNQHWQIPADDVLGPIVNQNSGMCMTTDGVAGDQLIQMPCVGAMAQEWIASTSNNFGMHQDSFYNPYYDLDVDVYGSSQWAGASIDGWYPNGGYNQEFIPW
jgi:Ricin-type beta-trefoil lectin domain-like